MAMCRIYLVELSVRGVKTELKEEAISAKLNICLPRDAFVGQALEIQTCDAA
jgi:hypothetical protein